MTMLTRALNPSELSALARLFEMFAQHGRELRLRENSTPEASDTLAGGLASGASDALSKAQERKDIVHHG